MPVPAFFLFFFFDMHKKLNYQITVIGELTFKTFNAVDAFVIIFVGKFIL